MDVQTYMLGIGKAARAASRAMAVADTRAKNTALTAMAAAIEHAAKVLLRENARDVEAAKAKKLDAAAVDRLTLTTARIEGMADGLRQIAALPDPVGEIGNLKYQPTGIQVGQMRVPLGVIGIIYESRPNVTADAGALCLKAGNAAILRGGSESFHTSRAIGVCLVEGLRAAGLPEDAIQLVPTTDREAVGHMLRMSEFIDIIVPRGGKSLIARVQQESRIPVIAHLDGNCHVYVDGAADLAMARKVVLNAKMRRVSVCGAAETVLVDRACAATHLAPVVKDLLDAGCEVRGDAATRAVDPRVKAAAEEDYYTEFLEPIIAAKVVDGVGAAIAHVEKYGSHHTDAIVTEDKAAAARFTGEVDSAIVLVNASTQFADGAEFGMGAEIGISTGRLHARGPVGAEQLTSYKYVVRGTGQIRP
ncbi:MAG: glutamate-5-semialdehyde dehydrogenase [Rhodospirillaceae bacterium]|nr:glutamate-5-semialdehyde dehydrogenase [Rhodospirillaceae bacterium]